MFCPNCGTSVESGNAFCPICGVSLGVIQSEDATPAEEPIVAPQPEYVAPVAEPVVATQPEYVAPVAPAPGSFELPGAVKDLPLIKQKFNPKDILNKIKGINLSGPKKKAIAIVAVVLVVAIIIGSVITATPAIAIPNAVDKTILDSSSFEFSISTGSYKVMKGKVDFGKNFEESGLYLDAGGAEIGYLNGEFTTSLGHEVELDDLIDQYSDMMDDLDYDFDLDIEETLNRIIKREIREEELLEIYDEKREVLEEMFSDMLDEDIVLPKSKELKSMVKDYMKHLPDGAVEIEKGRDNGKKIYEYEIDVEKLLVGLIEYTSEKSKYEEYYQYLEDICDMDADDLVDIIEDIGFEDIDGEIEIKGGYITEANVNFDGEKIAIKFKNVNKTKVNEDVIDDIDD